MDGAWNSSASLVTAALGLHAPHTVLVVLAHPRDLDGWTEDLVSFAGVRPLVFPAWDAWPGHDLVNDEVALNCDTYDEFGYCANDSSAPPRFSIPNARRHRGPLL